VLLAAGRAGEAEQAYREDLVRYPNNGWSLRGLARALAAEGRTREADEVDARFRRTWARADVQVM
jgi:cytochrome c-type biogenesis protein CcmH/NrfG